MCAGRQTGGHPGPHHRAGPAALSLTAKRRFAQFPVEIDVVSRFRTPAQMKATLMKVQSGKVDLLIGTHRLFQ